MIPTLASPGVMTPGQLGPTSVQSNFSIYAFTFTISCTGIPSVIQMITFIPASAASMIASPANFGGTKMIVVSARAFETASSTELNTGLPK